MLTHSFGNEFSYDDNTHWYPCLDEGYTDLKSGEEAHGYELVEDSSNDDAEYATYSCKCGHTVSRKKTVIVTLPTVVSDVIYVGQILSAFTLTGGEVLPRETDIIFDTPAKIILIRSNGTIVIPIISG